MAGNGIEDDEGYCGLPGEEDDEPEGGEDHDGSAPRPRRLMPIWLHKAFDTCVAEAGRQNQESVPLLYADHQTFWFHKKSNYFLLSKTSPELLNNPRFFLWDPKALCNDIPCPNCHHPLQRHGHISTPRRIVDMNSQFWILGYCMLCLNCIHPKSGKRTVTFRSWDPRILAVLTPDLTTEFPALLSHQSGISKPLFSFLRSCFQNGMGSKQFSDALRVQHLLQHDEQHLQYLQHLAAQALDGYVGKKYDDFLPFDDMSNHGPHGYVPSSQWLRDRAVHRTVDGIRPYSHRVYTGTESPVPVPYE